jgi:hypothetical protein
LGFALAWLAGMATLFGMVPQTPLSVLGSSLFAPAGWAIGLFYEPKADAVLRPAAP